MHEDTKVVKTLGKEVGTVIVTIYDTVEELIANVEESVILSMFNKANVIAMQAKERQIHSPEKMGKNKKMKLAFNLLSTEEIISCQGDYEALESLALTKMPEVEASLAADASPAADVETE